MCLQLVYKLMFLFSAGLGFANEEVDALLGTLSDVSALITSLNHSKDHSSNLESLCLCHKGFQGVFGPRCGATEGSGGSDVS